jgi:hypothetical protein
MLTASCPKCAKQVTVPHAARPESRVRCPLCAEEYSLESIFADLPPLLVLLDAPAPNGASGIHEGEAREASASEVSGSSNIFDFDEREKQDAQVADEDADTAIALADAEEVTPKTHAFDFGGTASPSAAAGGATAPRTTTARPKAKKKASPVKSIIGVIIGGLVALPLAQMILWYLPGGWGVDQRDPMNIGRNYPTTFGILAPSWVKDQAVTPAEEQVSGDPTGGPLKKPPQDAIDNIDPEGSSFGREDLNGALTGNTKPPKEDDEEESPLIVDDGSGSGEETIPPIDDPVIDEPAPKKSPVKDAPTFTAADLGSELKAAQAAEGLINTATKADGDGKAKREAAEQYLTTMSQLAKVLTFAAERPTGHMEHVAGMLTNASDTEKKRVILSTLAGIEFGKADRSSDGLIFTGNVREVQQRGKLFETVVEMSTTTKKPISVYTAADPTRESDEEDLQRPIAVGDTVVVLGAIIEEPNKNLSGYKGEPDPVIWGGYFHVVPE